MDITGAPISSSANPSILSELKNVAITAMTAQRSIPYRFFFNDIVIPPKIYLILLIISHLHDKI